MFYHLRTGIVSDVGFNPCCWLADNYIFFDYGCLLSVSLSLRDEIVDILKKALTCTDYISRSCDSLIALENVDEGTRNLCIYDKQIQLIINLEVEHFPSLIEFLNV